MSEPSSPSAGPLVAAPQELLSLPEVAETLAVKVTRVHQLLKDRLVLGVRRDGVMCLPAEFVDPRTSDGVVKGLPGTITLLTDAGFADGEILEWLYAADDSLPGRPIDALRQNRGREVHRRAQAAGF